jgi:hypothetical protein
MVSLTLRGCSDQAILARLQSQYLFYINLSWSIPATDLGFYPTFFNTLVSPFVLGVLAIANAFSCTIKKDEDRNDWIKDYIEFKE